jgi:hypothetical protein
VRGVALRGSAPDCPKVYPMRLFLALPLVLAGCGQPDAPPANSVDIDAAADAAQDSIENYAAATPTPVPAA